MRSAVTLHVLTERHEQKASVRVLMTKSEFLLSRTSRPATVVYTNQEKMATQYPTFFENPKVKLTAKQLHSRIVKRRRLVQDLAFF